MAEQFMI